MSTVLRVALLIAVSFRFTVSPQLVASEPILAGRDTPQGETYHVIAKVIYPNRVRDLSIQAELEPGPFTIPKGYVGTKLKYHWADPKTGLERDKLTGGTIYSTTQGRYVTEAKDDPNVVLYAGEYKVVCGGMPEATGVLTYTLIREDLVARPKPAESLGVGERMIDVVTWQAAPHSSYNPRLKATYRIRGGKVTGTIDQFVDPPKYDQGVTCDPMPTKGTFTGEINGNVITGKWEVKTGPHKMRFAAIPGTDYPNHDRTDTYSQSYDIRLVLKPDGTLSESMKGSGVSEWVWGPTAPNAIANERQSSTSNFEIPGKEIAEPLQGTWTERKT